MSHLEGHMLVWKENDLKHIAFMEQCQIQFLSNVLDHIIELKQNTEVSMD